MPKQKTIPELEAEIAAKERQLAQLQHKQQQLENRRSYYEEGDRRKRAHRLITRGAVIESVEPLAKVLTETEFYAFAEKVLALPEVKSLLMSAVNAHNATEQKGKAERKGIIYRTVPFSCNADQTKRRAVGCGIRRLPIRRKAAQRVLR